MFVRKGSSGWSLNSSEETFWIRIASDRLQNLATAVANPDDPKLIKQAAAFADAAVIEMIERRH